MKKSTIIIIVVISCSVAVFLLLLFTLLIYTNYDYPASTQNASSDPSITSWIVSTGYSSQYNAINNVNKIQYSSKYVYVSCSSVPSYSVGPWNGNPGTPSDQKHIFKFPRVPVANTGLKTSPPLKNIGILTNGVGIFNAEDAQLISGWKRNAYYFEKGGFDSCGGHPQNTGTYHNHIVPYCLFNYTDSTKHSPLIGFAFDGFPIYGPFGYSSASDSSSAIKRILSSYKLRNITSRTTLSSGIYTAGPSISTYPLGAFIDDYEYVTGYGDLDENNGRYGVTPEYPTGTYAYFTTTDTNSTPSYPYIIGKYYYGYVINGNILSGKLSPIESVTSYYTYSSSSNCFMSSYLLFLQILIGSFLIK